ncbi:hypothetical protein [Plantactinospora soyae]|uniref:DUF4245 domain-containing protein n=1 Tax=Plantactinospora soyae TaxID=1544732 RepID=A0A927M1N2_9ACTN|nr:hypothetical protein [Plantactinospora soyae]MBE1486457.1 hypothetical protein [Plantactinospora soyae]
MQEIVDVLRELPHVDSPAAASAETVAADVARGHRALIRRRRNRIAGSSLVVAAVAAMVVGVTQFGPAGSRPTAAGESGTTTQQAPRIQLVAFTGTQPAGFRVDTVPADWQVISSNRNEFVVVPPGADSSSALPMVVGSQGAEAEGSSVSYDGRIAVTLQGMSRLPSETPVTKVSVNGRDGLLGHAKGGVIWLIFSDAAGKKVLVQVPTSVGLTTDQVVSFAQGITVTSDAHSVGG